MFLSKKQRDSSLALNKAEKARQEFAPDYTVWMNTIKEGRFEDTNKMFENPPNCNYHVREWFTDTHQQLLEVVKNYMDRNNV